MSYLKGRKQSVNTKGIRILFQLIKSGVSQGSILRPILFNIFINDLFYLLQNDLHNFADDNTIAAVGQTVPDLINSLTDKSGVAIDWIHENSMINLRQFACLNPSKTHLE